MLLTDIVNYVNLFREKTFSINNILISRNVLKPWKEFTENNRHLMSLKICLECFEKYDSQYENKLEYNNVLKSLEMFLNRFNLSELYNINLEYITHQINNLIKYDFKSFVKLILALSFIPDNIKEQLNLFDTKQIIFCNRCHNIMTLKNIENCYDGRVDCDYTLQSVSTGQVFHCESYRSYSHPRGYDFNAQHLEEYTNNYFDRRLEERLRLNKNKNDQHIIILEKILHPSIKYFTNLWIDLEINTYTFTCKETIILKKLIAYELEILRCNENWDEIKIIYLKNAQDKLDILNDFIEKLSPDNFIFTSLEVKNKIIQHFREQYKNIYHNLNIGINVLQALNSLLSQLTDNDNIKDELKEIYDLSNDKIYNCYESLEELQNCDIVSNLIKLETVVNDQCISCVICMEDINISESCSILSECQHKFHNNCIMKWIKRVNSCPICRCSKKDVSQENTNSSIVEPENVNLSSSDYSESDSDSDYDINSRSDDMNQLDPLIDDPLFTNTYSSDSSENSDSDE